MIYRTLMRLCEPGLERPKNAEGIAIEGYLMKKKTTRVYGRVWVKRYVILLRVFGDTMMTFLVHLGLCA